MPFDRDLDELALIATAAREHSAWTGFADYCLLRGQGRRREAMARLSAFIDDMADRSFEERLAFVRWVTQERENICDGGVLLAQPLVSRLISPTLVDWVLTSPADADAQFLLALYDHRPDREDPLARLRRAIALDSGHERAKRTFVDRVTAHAENAQHELPWFGYLGSAEGDAHDLREARALIVTCRQPRWRDEIEREIVQFLEVALAWLEFEVIGGDFASWCIERGRPTSIVARIKG